MTELVSAVARAGVLALCATLRVRTVGAEHLEALRARGRPILFSVWHGRLLVPLHAHRDQGIAAMVSLSRDGDLAARTLERLGYRTVRGSSSRGGREAFAALRDRLLAGEHGAIIPDGPRGPARVLKSGIVRLAQECDAAVLPLSFSARHGRRLGSWDRFLVPCPFADTFLLYGEPLVVPAAASEADREDLRAQLTQRLDRLEREADVLAGRGETAPAKPLAGPA